MRLKSAILAAVCLACAGPAKAQYITPFNSWNFTSPPAGTVNGAPAAKPTPSPNAESCQLVSHGREIPRYDCKPAAKPNG